jgi:hypothetical protein
MVKRYNLTPAFGSPPPEGCTDAERKIAQGPLYDPAEVLKLLEKQSLKYWTSDCQKDVRDLDLDHEDVAALVIDAIRRGKFKNSEWCLQNPTGPWAACDAYLLRRLEWNRYAFKEIEYAYYVKFFISNTGVLLLLTSCHPQRGPK